MHRGRARSRCWAAAITTCPGRCEKWARCSKRRPSTRAAPPGPISLAWRAATAWLGQRVDEVLELVGLTAVATKRAGKFSLGMGQRLGIAAALLGDPAVLLFDEPVNGLDPEGIRWVRTLCKSLAAEGRTVFVSSHLMAEMALTADHLVVIGKGKLIAETSVADFVARSSRQSVKVRTPAPHQLSDAVTNAGGTAISDPDGSVTVTGLSAEQVGDLALSIGVALHELTPVASLEDAFMELTEQAVEFRAGQ